MPFPTTVDTIVDGPPFGPTTLGHASQVLGPQRITVGPTMYNIKSDQFSGGAKGDGITDDSAAVQATANAAITAGGGIVGVPPGTYIVNPTQAATGPPNVLGVVLGSNVTLQGTGRGNSILKQKASSSGFAPCVIGHPANAVNMLIRDLTIDGNGVNQTVASNGILFWQASRSRISGVEIHDIFGASGSEQSAIQLISSTLCRVEHVDSNAAGRPNNGVALSGCTACVVAYCTHQGTSSPWRGFVNDGSFGIDWIGCWSFLNTTTSAAFDCSSSQNVRYIGCIAGGVTNPQWQSFPVPSPFGFSQNLGNNGPGFNLSFNTPQNLDIEFIGCVSSNNTSPGLQQQSHPGLGLNACRVWGGDFSNNTIGFFFNGTNESQATRISGGPRMVGNTTAALQIGGTNYNASPAVQTAPAIPATGVAQRNFFPFDARVSVAGGTAVGIDLDGNATGLGSGVTYLVPSGSTITPNYTGAPTWVWHTL